jgi:hypothetical protein
MLEQAGERGKPTPDRGRGRSVNLAHDAFPCDDGAVDVTDSTVTGRAVVQGCWLQRYAATSDEACTIIPPPISDETRHPVQSNPATGSEEVLNLYPIQGAARYLAVGNFASAGAGRSNLPKSRTLRAVRAIHRVVGLLSR